MADPLPRWQVPRFAGSWDALPALPPLVLAADGSPAERPTLVRVGWDDAALHIRFDCTDDHAWGTYRRRDAPLYEEEVVEVFLAPGEDDPVDYFELEVSPLGALFDARIHNPTSRRADLIADVSWDCPGVVWDTGRSGARQDWWAILSIPWQGIAPSGDIPEVWRANFYRIERPADGPAEFSCWSSTLTEPADFHKPARFGRLELSSRMR